MTEYYTFEGGSLGYVPAKAPFRWEVYTANWDSVYLLLGSVALAYVVSDIDPRTGKICYKVDTYGIMWPMPDKYPTKEEAMEAVEDKFNEFWRGEL